MSLIRVGKQELENCILDRDKVRMILLSCVSLWFRELVVIRLVSLKCLNPIIYVTMSLLQAHSSVERAAMLGAVKYHIIESDEKYIMRGDALSKAIEEDRAKGLTPFYASYLHNKQAF